MNRQRQGAAVKRRLGLGSKWSKCRALLEHVGSPCRYVLSAYKGESNQCEKGEPAKPIFSLFIPRWSLFRLPLLIHQGMIWRTFTGSVVSTMFRVRSISNHRAGKRQVG